MSSILVGPHPHGSYYIRYDEHRGSLPEKHGKVDKPDWTRTCSRRGGPCNPFPIFHEKWGFKTPLSQYCCRKNVDIVLQDHSSKTKYQSALFMENHSVQQKRRANHSTFRKNILYLQRGIDSRHTIKSVCYLSFSC